MLEEGIPFESQAFQAIGYREVAEWIQGCGRRETEERIVTATRQLA